MTGPTVDITSVGKNYGRKHAVQDVSLTVHPGECLALVGHNGAGKTTLMKMMLGLIRPSAGRVRVLGDDPGNSAAVRDRFGIGFLPETVSFDDAMTGTEVMTFFARLKGVSVVEGLSQLDRVQLADAAPARIKTYSKGMRQRLGLAQALLGEPRLLLLDEPTTGLDPNLRQAFYEIIRELCAGGTSVILSSHILTELEARTDRVAIMNQGRLVACDTLDALRNQAGLAVRIRLRVKQGDAGAVASRLKSTAELTRVNGQYVDLICGTGNKMMVLRDIAALGSEVGDVDILPPTFDEVYNHFCLTEKLS
jgi:Cu-processing system ATP-binding protein